MPNRKAPKEGPEAARLARGLEAVENDESRRLIARFLTERQVNGHKPRTALSQLVPLRDLANALGGRPISDVRREDVAEFLSHKTTRRTYKWGNHGGEGVTHVRDVPLAKTTRAERAKIVRSFCRWVGRPEAGDWIKPNRSRVPSVQAEDLLTRAELERIINAARSARDRAIIALLAESGFREGEVCALRIGDLVALDDGAIRVTLPESETLKTGRRSVVVFDSAGQIHEWLREHPARRGEAADEGSEANARWRCAPLFCGWDADEPLKERSIYDLVVRTGRRAKLSKHVHPHLLRFGAATHDAKRGMPPAAMTRKYGWSDSSPHVLYYARLAQSDVEEWERQQRGLAATKAPDGSLIQPIECPRCKLANRPGTAFCGRCARPLTHAAESELETRKGEELKRMIAEEIRRALGQA